MSLFLASRKRALAPRLVSTWLVAVITAWLPSVAAAAEGKSAVALPAEEFPLGAVRLLDGPFRHATELDRSYLLKLEPDRLLAWFRKEAGLPPKAAVYGGWESQGVAGHCLGHYLSACAKMYQTTGEAEFKRRVDYVVEELAACQRANGNGYVGAIPRGKEIFAELARGDIRSQGFDLNGGWVPFYTLHKDLAGLRDAYRLADNAQALEVEKGSADFIGRSVAGLSQEQMQQILRCEHGGMMEVLADLSADTGERRYLELSRRFYHEAVLRPLAEGKDQLEGLHANTQIPKLVGLAARYELTGDPEDRRAAEFFWERVVYHHSYVTGGHCNGEHFGAPDRLNDRLGPNTTETCNVYNMLKLTRHLFQWRADAKVADYYERALYNHILASQNPVDGRVNYNLSLAIGGHKEYQTQFDSFSCCVGTGMENHAQYGAGIYFHKQNMLFVNLFIASDLRWQEQGVTVRQETRFPETEETTLTFDCAEPKQLTVRIRHPYWAGAGFSVSLNGQPLKTSSTPSSYAEVTRRFKRGDRLTVKLPMALRLEAMPDNPRRVAILHGPIVVAGNLGPIGEPAAAQADYVPVLLTGERPVAEWVYPVAGQPGIFRTAKVGVPRDIELVPFYQVHDRCYTVYWDLFSQEQWADRQAEYRAAGERRRQLEARTVDFFQPGEMQPERDHHLQGDKTSAGDFGGHKWRHAWDGGWFAWDMRVQPEKLQALVLTYWGGDGGWRVFDVLANGTRLATQSLESKKPGQFLDVTYPLPAELVRGCSNVTVRLQGHPFATVGGLFGARVVRQDRVPPAPLFRDPVYDGAADPTLVWSEQEQCWWMLYTNRRATAYEDKQEKWVHGTDIGLASTPDGGVTWVYRGVARGLEFEPGRNTFWAPEVVRHEGRYHAFISYVRGVPETWGGTRDIVHYTSTNLLDWKYEGIVIPGSIDACVHRLPDGRWRMWFKNEQKKYPATAADSTDLSHWEPSSAGTPDGEPEKGEGPDVVFWHGWFWMVKDLWRGLGVYRSPDGAQWEFKGLILNQSGSRPGDHSMGQHPGLLVQDEEKAYIFYFVHQEGDALASRHTVIQVARLGFDGQTLTCNRDEDFPLSLQAPRAEFTPEWPPALSRAHSTDLNCSKP